ncbi:MAG: hypothetical protein AAFU53_16595, partial [Cyanobacteria bacterium J06632_3]
FGGDREDLPCADPFLGQHSEEDSVLGYLSQQISAFTVGRLPQTSQLMTNLSVLDRPDEPKRETVLRLDAFRLGDLTVSDADKPDTENPDADAPDTNNRGEQTPNLELDSDLASSDTLELTDLSQQVSALNRKIEYLSKKLEEATRR